LRTYGNPCTGWLLDAGCGTGALLSELHQQEPGSHLVGLDVEPHALHYARQRGEFPLVQARLEALPFRSDTFRYRVEGVGASAR
jgi:ubiquinone/menaquinone biosynthesis C-methylase UbiE